MFPLLKSSLYRALTERSIYLKRGEKKLCIPSGNSLVFLFKGPDDKEPLLTDMPTPGYGDHGTIWSLGGHEKSRMTNVDITAKSYSIQASDEETDSLALTKRKAPCQVISGTPAVGGVKFLEEIASVASKTTVVVTVEFNVDICIQPPQTPTYRDMSGAYDDPREDPFVCSVTLHVLFAARTTKLRLNECFLSLPPATPASPYLDTRPVVKVSLVGTKVFRPQAGNDRRYTLYASENMWVAEGRCSTLDTKRKFTFPPGFRGRLVPHGSLASRVLILGDVIYNSASPISLSINLLPVGKCELRLKQGDPVADLIVEKYTPVRFEEIGE